MTTPNKPSAHQSLERGLAALQYAARAGGVPVALSDTARYLGLHRSTCYRLLQDLVLAGYLSQHEESRRYAVGQKLTELAALVYKDET